MIRVIMISKKEIYLTAIIKLTKVVPRVDFARTVTVLGSGWISISHSHTHSQGKGRTFRDMKHSYKLYQIFTLPPPLPKMGSYDCYKYNRLTRKNVSYKHMIYLLLFLAFIILVENISSFRTGLPIFFFFYLSY